VGMTVIVSKDKAAAVQRFIATRKQKAWVIGEVVKGSGVARVE